MASYHTPVSSSPLTKAEREIICTLADDEDAWTVHTDSRRALSGRLLRLARAWGVVSNPGVRMRETASSCLSAPSGSPDQSGRRRGSEMPGGTPCGEPKIRGGTLLIQ